MSRDRGEEDAPPNPFERGRAAEATGLDGVSLEDARPGPRVVLAGVVSLLAGVMGAVAAMQVLVFLVIFQPILALLPYLQVALGLAQSVAGGALSRSRGWAAWASVGLAGVSLAVWLAWGVFALLNGWLSLLGGLVIGVQALAVLLTLLVRAEAVATDAARQALYADP